MNEAHKLLKYQDPPPCPPPAPSPLFRLGWLLLAFLGYASLACAPVPEKNEGAAEDQANAERPAPENTGTRSEFELEDPPYALDSVFKPEDHRAAVAPLPDDVVLLDQILEPGPTFEANAHLGESVAIAGNLVAGGAPYADVGDETDAGAVCVFLSTFQGFRRCERLVAPEPRSYDRFGASVALSGSILVVGANRHDGVASDAGGAYVFMHSCETWSFMQKLAPGDLKPGASFGFSAALSGSTLVVGAPGMAEARVYVRGEGPFTEQSRLVAPRHVAHGGFGHSVAIDGDLLVVGANTYENESAAGPLMLSGAAFVFRRQGDTWQLEQELRSPREEALARFGTAVAIRGGRVLVGASRATVGTSTRAGAAFLFERRGERWEAIATLERDPPRSDEELGRAIALLPEGALLGSQFGDAAGLNTGGALFFAPKDGVWRRQAALLAKDRAEIHELAFAIAADDKTWVLGAPRRNSRATATGALYVVTLPP